jgi:hypothetical protein
MREAILRALRERRDLVDWSLRQVSVRGAQLYAVPQTVEAKRAVESENFTVDVFRDTRGANGEAGTGSGNVTLLRDDDIRAGLDRAALLAGLVHNPPHGIPGPAEMPQVPLVDKLVQDDGEAVLVEFYEALRTAVAGYPGIRLTSAEFFVEEQTTRLTNSRRIDVEQTATLLHLTWVWT